MQSDSRKALACLLLVTAAAYAVVASLGWCWDDRVLVAEHPLTGDLAAWPAFFQQTLWQTVGIEGPPYYRPLVLLSFGVDAVISGPSPAFAHLHSLAWHLAAVAALWALLRELRPGWPALVGTGLYALHPLQSETIAFVAARNDPMATTGALLALLAWLPAQASARRILAGSAALFLALLAKESAVMFPVLLLALDLARWGRPRGWARYVGAAAAVGAVLVIRELAGVPSGMVPGEQSMGLLVEKLPALAATYGSLLLVPWPLSVGRLLPYLDPGLPVVLGGLAALGLAGSLLGWRGGRLALAGLAFAALSLLPGLFAIAGTTYIMERYASTSLVGWALALCAAWPAGRRWLAGAAATGLAWIVLLQLALPAWRSDAALFAAAAARTPNPHSLHRHATELEEAGRVPEALEAHAEGVLALPGPRYPGSCLASSWLALRAGAHELGAAFARAEGCRSRGELGAVQAVSLAFVGDWAAVAERTAEAERPRPELWRAAAAAAAHLQGGEAELHRQEALAAGADARAFDALVDRILAAAP